MPVNVRRYNECPTFDNDCPTSDSDSLWRVLDCPICEWMPVMLFWLQNLWNECLLQEKGFIGLLVDNTATQWQRGTELCLQGEYNTIQSTGIHSQVGQSITHPPTFVYSILRNVQHAINCVQLQWCAWERAPVRVHVRAESAFGADATRKRERVRMHIINSRLITAKSPKELCEREV